MSNHSSKQLFLLYLSCAATNVPQNNNFFMSHSLFTLRTWCMSRKWKQIKSLVSSICGHVAMCWIEIWYLCDIYFTQNLFIFYVNSMWYDRLITDETKIWLCSYVKEIYVLYLKTLGIFIALLSSDQYTKYWQSCFNAVFSTLKQRRWTNSTFIFNQI